MRDRVLRFLRRQVLVISVGYLLVRSQPRMRRSRLSPDALFIVGTAALFVNSAGYLGTRFALWSTSVLLAVRLLAGAVAHQAAKHRPTGFTITNCVFTTFTTPQQIEFADSGLRLRDNTFEDDAE